MHPAPAIGEPAPDTPDTDDALVQRVKRGDLAAFELLMRRHNQKLFRAVRSVLRSGDEVEDVMQETYLAAFRHLDQFEGRSRFSTWLLRIGINEALARVRGQARLVDLDELPEERTMIREPYGPLGTPEQQAANREVVTLVESALDQLPDQYRQVFVLRLVECLDTAEVSQVLGLSEAAVKQRLHRARVMVQDQIEGQIGSVVQSVFGFLGERCDRVVAGVLLKIGNSRTAEVGGGPAAERP